MAEARKGKVRFGESDVDKMPQPCPFIPIFIVSRSLSRYLSAHVASLAMSRPVKVSGIGCEQRRHLGAGSGVDTNLGRYIEIPYDEMTPEQQEGYRFLVETRGAAGGPSKMWVHNPKLVKASAPLGAHFHPGGYSLSEREREIAVIIINSKWHSAYPTNAHERRGKEVGLPAEKVEAMLSGLPTSFADEREQTVYEMAICLSNSRWVSKGLYDRAVRALGHVGITDVITLMGYYTSVSMTLAFYDVPAGASGIAR